MQIDINETVESTLSFNDCIKQRNKMFVTILAGSPILLMVSDTSKPVFICNNAVYTPKDNDSSWQDLRYRKYTGSITITNW